MNITPKLVQQPSRARSILAKYKTSAEIDIECALWTVELLAEYKFLPEPIKPQIVSLYEGDLEKDTLNDSYFNDHPGIRIYYESRRTSRLNNSSVTDWLKRCREILMLSGHTVEGRLITDKLEKEVIKDGRVSN